MKPTPLLDFWQKPANAGEPVALFATTFALEPDFFEQNCLARFLEVSSVSEGAGSVDDIVANVELHELLQKVSVTVLADRSASVQRASLLWDLLSCKVNGALLHSKVAVLLWEKATRVILGSMNLTSAGYRRQIELGLVADLGSSCLFPSDVLHGIEHELASYLELVPGYDAGLPVFSRARETLDMFSARIGKPNDVGGKMRVAFAPTSETARPLDRVRDVWRGSEPLGATHLSPFWDGKDPTGLESVGKLLTGRPASKRTHRVAVVLGPQGQISFPGYLAQRVDSVSKLKPLDGEIRLLHAKCLLLESDNWVAALVGSSNHTLAGFGLKKYPHREMNVWLGAPRASEEGKALLDLIQLDGKVVDNSETEEVPPEDEDEVDLPSLPACFELCRVCRLPNQSTWELQLGIRKTRDMPEDWSVSVAGEAPVLDRARWEAQGARDATRILVDSGPLPLCVQVRWQDYEVPWAVVVDDRHGLPPGPALSGLRAQQLLKALATGRSLGDVLRERLDVEKRRSNDGAVNDLDPLRRLEIQGSLLRKGRELAASLSAMQRRLERQVITLETLSARLTGPLGPEFLAQKIAEDCAVEERTRSEALFTVAEIALSVGRVNWRHVIEHVDRKRGFRLVDETLSRLTKISNNIGSESASIAAYADRAMEEARRCLRI